MTPCKNCLRTYGKPLCEGLKGCVFEDVPAPKDEDILLDALVQDI